MLLPLFPPESIPITDVLSFEKRDGIVYYFHAGAPVHSHSEGDLNSFRLFTSQLVVNGLCKQVDLVRAFGISAISVKRWVKRYREEGAAGFFRARAKRGPSVLTPEVLAQAQELFDGGASRAEVAQRLELKRNTLSKAIASGRLAEKKRRKRRGSPPQVRARGV